MDVYSQLAPLFHVSKLLGLAPVELTGDVGRRRIVVSRQYRVVSGAVVLFILALKAHNLFWFQSSPDTAPVTLSVVLAKNNFDIALTLLAVVLHNAFAERALQFIRELDALDCAMHTTLGKNSLDFKKGQRFLVFHVFFLLAFVSGGLFAIFYMFNFIQTLDYTRIGYWALYFTSLLINLMFASHFLAYVFLLRQRFAALKLKVEELLAVTAANAETRDDKLEPKLDCELPSNDGVDTTIVNIRKYHFKLCDLAHDINEIYSPLMLLFFASAFAGITILLNNCFEDARRIFLGKATASTVQYMGFCFCLVVTLVVHIAVITGVCTSAGHEANRVSLPLHGLLATTSDTRVRMQAEKFSLQLLHRKLRFTAFGFFPIDATLMFAIVGGVTTYLVILIQFDLSLNPA